MRTLPPLVLAFVAAVFLSGCEAIGGLLRLGFWSGVILVVLIVGVLFLVSRVFRR